MSAGRSLSTQVALSSVLALAVLVVASSILGGGAVGLAVADDSAPGEPASFYGAANDTDGNPIPANETIVAVVDGNTVDSIPVDPPGKYGGGGAFDDKLRVDSEAGDAVVFRFADREGPIGGSAELEPGVFETNLTFSTAVFGYISPDAVIEIDPAELSPGEAVHLSGANATAYDDTELVGYNWSIERGGEVVETFTDESATYHFEETGTYDVELEITDGNGRTNATTAMFEVDPELSAASEEDGGDDSDGGATTTGGTSSTGGGGSVGGTTGGSGSSGGSTSGSDGSASDNSSKTTDIVDPIDEFDPSSDPTVEETVRIDNSFPEVPGTTVGFDRSTVSEILFDDDEISGDVIVREFDSATDDVPPLPGDLRIVSAIVLTVPSEHRDSSAVIRARVDPERLKVNDQLPSNLSVYRLAVGADQWQELPTETFETSEEIVVEAETPGFSQFVISAPETPELIADESSPDTDDSATEEASNQRDPERESASVTDKDATVSTDESATGSEGVGFARPVGALVALLVVVGTVGRILVPRRRGR